MSAKSVQGAAQVASKAVSKPQSSRLKLHLSPKNANLGRQIFVYNHLQTNQVVYSLTKSLKNSHALRQLPYNGKKTVPAALRKDLWAPLACISFSPPDSPPSSSSSSSPSSSPSSTPTPERQGLKTFQKLREYRKLHETLWPKSLAKAPSGRILSRVERGRKLCDQKANSVADMAAALAATTVRRLGTKVVEKVQAEGKEKKPVKKEKVVEHLAKATILWKDVLDAEFAERWPETVVHDKWEVMVWNNRRPKNGGWADIEKVGLGGLMARKEGGGEAEIEAVRELEPVKRNEAGKVEL